MPSEEVPADPADPARAAVAAAAPPAWDQEPGAVASVAGGGAGAAGSRPGLRNRTLGASNEINICQTKSLPSSFRRSCLGVSVHVSSFHCSTHRPENSSNFYRLNCGCEEL